MASSISLPYLRLELHITSVNIFVKLDFFFNNFVRFSFILFLNQALNKSVILCFNKKSSVPRLSAKSQPFPFIFYIGFLFERTHIQCLFLGGGFFSFSFFYAFHTIQFFFISAELFEINNEIIGGFLYKRLKINSFFSSAHAYFLYFAESAPR